MEGDAMSWDYSVVPGVRVGPFKLGMSLHEASQILKSMDRPVAGDTGKTVLCFSRSAPLEKPIVLEIKTLGVRLRFEPKYQKLLVIDVFNVNVIPLSFQGHFVGGRNRSTAEAGTLKHMYEILGVTHSGFRKEELDRDAFCLQYPGLLVAFQVPTKEAFTGIPLVITGGVSPPLVRVVVHEFEFSRNVAKPIVRSSRTVDVTVSDERPVEVAFADSGGLVVVGESTCQDVLACLGSPNKIHLKQQEPIGTKARRQAYESHLNQSEDYFLNYFDIGLDILMDGRLHTVRKVILRTNLLAHPVFGQYDKCSFTVKFVESFAKNAKKSPGVVFSSRDGFVVTGNGKSKGKQAAQTFEDLLTTSVTKPGADKGVQVSCDEQWPSIAKKFEIQDEKPMVNEKADQPFGPCFLFGYRHSVFEVDKSSLHLASLTLF